MFTGIAAFAQQPPTLSKEQTAKFFKAQAQAQSAQIVLQQTPQFKTAQEKQQAFQDEVNALVKFCGEKFPLLLIKDGKPDNDGDPTCTVKPEPPKPVVAPKAAPASTKTPDAPKK